jgi:hypothetical protein
LMQVAMLLSANVADDFPGAAYLQRCDGCGALFAVYR